MELRVFEYTLPLVTPFVFGQHEVRERRGWLVELCEGAVSGWGDAAPLPGFSAEREDAVRALWGVLPTDGLVPPGRVGHGANAAIAEDLAWRRLPPSVRGALETAWCDLQARREGVPLAQWLEPAAGPTVRCNATIGGGDVRLRRIRIAAAVRSGYTMLKLKTGGLAWCDELDLLEEIATLYPGVGVRLDPNGLWTREETESRLRSLRDLPVEYVEQPVAADDVDALLQLARGPDGGRVAADEVLLAGDAVQARLLAADGVRRVVLKPAALGGPLASLALVSGAAGGGAAAASGRAPLGVTVTTMLESSVGRAMAAHVAAAVDARCGAAAHGLATGGLLARDVAEWPDGPALELAGPGLGVVPDVVGLERVR